MECHEEMTIGKATGVDGVTKEMYERNLEDNVGNLVKRLKQKSYRPLPARRTYIPKDEKSMRPLGIPAYEDKLVQHALKNVYLKRFMNKTSWISPMDFDRTKHARCTEEAKPNH